MKREIVKRLTRGQVLHEIAKLRAHMLMRLTERISHGIQTLIVTLQDVQNDLDMLRHQEEQLLSPGNSDDGDRR
jgi:hypothetical protein